MSVTRQGYLLHLGGPRGSFRRMGGDDAGEVYARRRTSFGAMAAEYDAVRPSWQAESVGWMLGSPTPSTVLRVVDLGAGTGKGTRTLARMGHDVVAVEPAEGMLGALRGSLRSLPPEVAARVDARDGSAEHLPVEDGTADAVTVFQAWHWFDHAAAARECARVLRPGGWLSMAWHRRDESVGWQEELSGLVDRHESIAEDEDFPPMPEAFEPVERAVFGWTMRQSPPDLARHAGTWSFVAIRPDRDEVLDRVRALGDRVAGPDGMVELPMLTECYRLRRR